jgi:hypothetical protein
MSPVHLFHAEITRLALRAAKRHGFALGGGNALLLHGVVDRPTADVDLFTDRDDHVRVAADFVREALTSAGMAVVEVRPDNGLDWTSVGEKMWLGSASPACRVRGNR